MTPTARSHFLLRLVGAAVLVTLSCLACAAASPAASPASAASPAPAASAATAARPDESDAALDPRLRERHQETHGAVQIKGRTLQYRAVAGLLPIEDSKEETSAVMSYVAYFAQPAQRAAQRSATRPVTFLYNGGPGSSSVWLHLGAFGPKRVLTGNGRRGQSAPYPLIDNEFTLLDASDLVFIDAPGTGFGRIVAVDKDKLKERESLKDKEKEFWGVDQDAHAFARFIKKFLTRHDLWNAPKYLLGESYGTMRSAVLANLLQSEDGIDLNGVILVSQVLSLGSMIDEPQYAPGDDMPYVLALPTFAATAWYHDKLPAYADRSPQTLQALLGEVRKFAMGEYLQALAAGPGLDARAKHAMAERLSGYVGLPTTYVERANLRVNGGMFCNTLLSDRGLTVGRLDSRYAGPSLDGLAKESGYDPQTAAIASAYVSVYNDYARVTLQFGGTAYRPFIDDMWKTWDFAHKPPGADRAMKSTTNVMPDLSSALITNPRLKVDMHAGYYDLATPFAAADYELAHLTIPADLRGNIRRHFYPAGHMMYDDPDSLAQLHDNVATFIRETDNLRH